MDVFTKSFQKPWIDYICDKFDAYDNIIYMLLLEGKVEYYNICYGKYLNVGIIRTKWDNSLQLPLNPNSQSKINKLKEKSQLFLFPFVLENHTNVEKSIGKKSDRKIKTWISLIEILKQTEHTKQR